MTLAELGWPSGVISAAPVIAGILASMICNLLNKGNMCYVGVRLP